MKDMAVCVFCSPDDQLCTLTGRREDGGVLELNELLLALSGPIADLLHRF